MNILLSFSLILLGLFNQCLDVFRCADDVSERAGGFAHQFFEALVAEQVENVCVGVGNLHIRRDFAAGQPRRYREVKKLSFIYAAALRKISAKTRRFLG